MKKCDFCPKYNPFGSNGPRCDAYAGSSYCEDAIKKMTEVLKSMNISPAPKKEEPTDDDVKKLMAHFFGV